MREIKLIAESDAKALIESEVKNNRDKGYIIEGEGFSQHLIDSGRIGWDISKEIIKKHPSLKEQIDPEIIRVEGYVHDFSKIYEGSKFHEIGTAYLVLTAGDTELGLVSEGTKSERKETLKKIASLILSDHGLFEELGGLNFPEQTLYPDMIDSFKERIEYLRTELSDTNIPLSINELALPLTLNQQIALYADLTNVNGKRVSIEERLLDIQKRYSDPKRGYNNPTFANVANMIMPRALVIEGTIESLMK
ncbi:MAG: hypothetical protein ISS25_02420 [Nanoarchaeota archaeon]|nr:hypothetical protein [DPANN group archaeon]MBL7116659.1 hypothetical protein [Nanoarchaeota archaeon]